MRLYERKPIATCWCSALALLVVVSLSGCSTLDKQEYPLAGPPPAYERLIRAALQPDAKKAAEGATEVTKISNGYAPYEISSPKQMNVIGGWMWRVCLEGNNKGSKIYISVFIKGDHIADARTSIPTDGCGLENYKPFN